MTDKVYLYMFCVLLLNDFFWILQERDDLLNRA